VVRSVAVSQSNDISGTGTGAPPSSLLLSAASMKAKSSSVSSGGTGGFLVLKNFTISSTRPR